MTSDGFHAYTYDAEGNVTAVDSGATGSYVYDALNHRVRTAASSTATEFVFNASGQRVSEWDGNTHAQLKGKYYWGSQPVAYYTPGGAAHFEHQDWLGTERKRTAYNAIEESTATSLPFGDAQSSSGADGDASHFAMLDSDSESGTDHAQFRQYSTTQGRWLSPDPYSGSYDFRNPQSFNRYTYVLNNPLSMNDPSGLKTVCTQTKDKNGKITVTCKDDGTSNDPCGTDYSACVNAGEDEGYSNVGVSQGGIACSYCKLLQRPFKIELSSDNGNAPNKGTSLLASVFKDVKNCIANVALPTIANDLNPLGLGIGTAADAASSMSQASLAGAASWSVSRGLTVPLRSSIVRAGVAGAETLGKVSGILTMGSVVYALGDAVVAEYKQCY
jgi:RHS repeat-associated protein